MKKKVFMKLSDDYVIYIILTSIVIVTITPLNGIYDQNKGWFSSKLKERLCDYIKYIEILWILSKKNWIGKTTRFFFQKNVIYVIYVHLLKNCKFRYKTF